MNPYPAARSVLVMDNASIHHSEEVKLLCEAAGVRLEYLPPYSPDYNPIELSFHCLKVWMRRNKTLAAQYRGNFEVFFHIAISQCNFRKEARALFRDAQIEVKDDD